MTGDDGAPAPEGRPHGWTAAAPPALHTPPGRDCAAPPAAPAPRPPCSGNCVNFAQRRSVVDRVSAVEQSASQSSASNMRTGNTCAHNHWCQRLRASPSQASLRLFFLVPGGHAAVQQCRQRRPLPIKDLPAPSSFFRAFAIATDCEHLAQHAAQILPLRLHA